MKSNRLPAILLLIAPVAVMGVLLPYLVAVFLPPAGSQFTGFLINPIDGFSYLAKMRQGYAGGWSFQLPYALQTGPGAYIFTYYILLGHLAREFSLPLLVAYHASRVLAAAFMFTSLGTLAWKFLRSGSGRLYAVTWLFFGSGLGWIGAAAGVLGSDLMIPESVPFAAAFANAHFPMALALIAVLILVAMSRNGRLQKALLVGLLGLALSIVLPFATISLLIAISLWSLWEATIAVRSGRGWSDQWKTDVFLSLAAFTIGAMPVLLYDYSLTITHPVLAVWHAQNETPSPGVLSYLVGLGPVILVAAIGLWAAWDELESPGRLMLVWAASGLLLLYAPFGLQRRLSLGLFVPLALLAGNAYAKWARGVRWRQWFLLSILLATVPTNITLIAAGQSQVGSGQYLLVYRPGERAAYEWIKDNVEQGAVILAAPVTGNRLPAFANVRVLYGHPFETPYAEAQRRWVESTFRDEVGQFKLNMLQEIGIDYVYYGPNEADLGHPAWLDQLAPSYRSADVTIYSITR